MQENELKYYEEIGNWQFDQIKCKAEKIKQKIKKRYDFF